MRVKDLEIGDQFDFADYRNDSDLESRAPFILWQNCKYTSTKSLWWSYCGSECEVVKITNKEP